MAAQLLVGALAVGQLLAQVKLSTKGSTSSMELTAIWMPASHSPSSLQVSLWIM